MKRSLQFLALALLLTLTTAAHAEQGAVEAVQQEVKDLLGELDVMRNNPTFWKLCFSTKNPQASAWVDKVEKLRAKLDSNKDLPLMLRAAPGNMRGLGLEWCRNKGAITPDAKETLEQIFEGLSAK